MFWQPIQDLSLHRRDDGVLVDAGTPAGAEDRPYIGNPLNAKQIIWLGSVTVLGTLLLLIRAFYLQINRGGYYLALAEGNRTRNMVLVAPRGILYDQYGKALTENSPELRLALIPFALPKSDEERGRLFNEISRLSGADFNLINDTWQQLSPQRRQNSDAVLLDYPLTTEAGLRLQLLSRQWPGVSVVTIPRRRLSDATPLSLSHVIGYVGKVGEEDMANGLDYTTQDIIGKNGLELSYENVLRGKNGLRAIEVNALGEEQLSFTEKSPISGRHIRLTIDKDLQFVAENALQAGLEKANAQKGVVVVMNPSDGSVYALVSLPTFDANKFNEGIGGQEFKALQDDVNHPLFPRAIQGTYPSGSTIKPVLAAAALADGIITANSTFLSVGGIAISSWFFPDWKAGGHGQTDVRKALAESVNTFFYIIGGGYGETRGLGIARMREWAQIFGLGKPTGIDLPNEAAGFFPTPEWKEDVKKERWYIGDTYHAAIGQGDVLVTPLQVANYTAAFANGGTLWRPHLVKEIVDSDNKEHIQPQAEVIRNDIAPKEDIEVVRQGMRQAVTYGSSRNLADLPIEVAGKTGTAEVGGDNKAHAWFTGFGPYESPTLVVTVLLENSGEGSTYAVPIAKEIFKWWSENRME